MSNMDINAIMRSQSEREEDEACAHSPQNGMSGDAAAPSDCGAPVRTSFFLGALRKVHDKIKAELDAHQGDESEEQRLNDEFERAWLGEFDDLRAEYQTKWDTCTHSADEFCGLLFHSSDAQQQAYLLREYPTLMETWRDADLRAGSLRVRPDWPPARIAEHAAVEYAPPSPPMADRSPATATATPTQRVKTSPALHEVVSLLRVEYQWSARAVEAFTLSLERAQIFSCAELLAALALRRSAFAERAFQSREYPRLSKAMLRALQTRAAALERRHESVRELCMEPLRVNPF